MVLVMPEGSKWSDFFNTKLGRMIMGIIKLSMASLLVSLISSIPRGNDPQIGGTVVPVSTILTIIIAFAPILLLISALRDLEIW